MNGFKCPDCDRWLKEGAYKCICKWRSKLKEKEHSNCCRKCGNSRAFRCGPDHDPYFLCDPHREELKANIKEAKEEREAIQSESSDYLQDLSEGKI